MPRGKKQPANRWVPADVLIGQLMADVGDDSPSSKALVRELRQERLAAERRARPKKRRKT